MMIFRTALVVAAGLSLAGCNQYWERTDTMTFGSGNAVASNSALMIPTPWPPGSRDTRIVSDGERSRLAIERYRKGTVTQPQGLLGAGAGMAPTAPTQ